MTKYTPEEIKNRLSNIGEAIGSIALEYIVELEKENEQLKARIEKMKCCANCDYWFDMDSTCELHKKEISDFMVDCSCKDWECAYKEVEE